MNATLAMSRGVQRASRGHYDGRIPPGGRLTISRVTAAKRSRRPLSDETEPGFVD